MIESMNDSVYIRFIFMLNLCIYHYSLFLVPKKADRFETLNPQFIWITTICFPNLFTSSKISRTSKMSWAFPSFGFLVPLFTSYILFRIKNNIFIFCWSIKLKINNFLISQVLTSIEFGLYGVWVTLKYILIKISINLNPALIS